MARFFWPGLLSIIGTSGPFALAWLFLTAPASPTHSGGSESSLAAALGLFFGLVIGAWGLWLLSLAIGLLVDPAHSRIWGPMVAFFYGIGYIPLLILYGAAFSSDLQTATIGMTGTTTYVLGFAGGVWGLFWHTGVNPRAWTLPKIVRTMRGLSGRVTVGGLGQCCVFDIRQPGSGHSPICLGGWKYSVREKQRWEEGSRCRSARTRRGEWTLAVCV